MLPPPPAPLVAATVKPRRRTGSTAAHDTNAPSRQTSPTGARKRKSLPALAKPVAVAMPTPPAAEDDTNASAPAAPVVTHEQVCQRAYEIWIAKGRPYGQDDANWREALQQLGQA